LPRMAVFALLVVLAVLSVSTLSGCAGRPNGAGVEAEAVPLTAVLGSGLDAVERIEIRYGDGRVLFVTEPETIRELVALVKAITVRASEFQSAGYLYFMDLVERERTLRVGDRYTNLDDRTYETVDDDASRELNFFLLRYGRARIPDLLPGIMPEIVPASGG